MWALGQVTLPEARTSLPRTRLLQLSTGLRRSWARLKRRIAIGWKRKFLHLTTLSRNTGSCPLLPAHPPRKPARASRSRNHGLRERQSPVARELPDGAGGAG